MLRCFGAADSRRSDWRVTKTEQLERQLNTLIQRSTHKRRSDADVTRTGKQATNQLAVLYGPLFCHKIVVNAKCTNSMYLR